jgi:hypothetical protein
MQRRLLASGDGGEEQQHHPIGLSLTGVLPCVLRSSNSPHDIAPPALASLRGSCLFGVMRWPSQLNGAPSFISEDAALPVLGS